MILKPALFGRLANSQSFAYEEFPWDLGELVCSANAATALWIPLSLVAGLSHNDERNSADAYDSRYVHRGKARGEDGRRWAGDKDC